MKVKCKLCGKVGQENDTKALNRHMRLAHGKSSAKGYFEEADQDSIIDLMSVTRKEFRKQKNKISNQKLNVERKKELRKKKGPNKHKSIYWGAVLKSGFETKR